MKTYFLYNRLHRNGKEGEDMPNIESDFVARVRRLSYAPSQNNSILPLLEAISNAFHAIEDKKENKGQIDIKVTLDNSEANIVICDNGIGLNTKNFQAFKTLDTSNKIERGGKGIGRLSWLRAFNHVNVESVFEENGTTYKRVFDFSLKSENQISSDEFVPFSGETGTKIFLGGMVSDYLLHFPKKKETLVKKIISHFLPVFIASKAPLVKLTFDSEVIDVNAFLEDEIKNSVSQELKFDLEDGKSVELSVTHIKLNKSFRETGCGDHRLFLTANNRTVREQCIDNLLGVGLLDEQSVYVGCVKSSYLDEKVNQERNFFLVEGKELEQIVKKVISGSKEFLAPYIRDVLEAKKAIINQLLKDNPQFCGYIEDIDEAAKELAPNCIKKEDIFIQLCYKRVRKQNHYARIKAEILEAEDIISVQKQVDDYSHYIGQEQKNMLAEYVLKRRAILDLLEKIMMPTETGKSHLEKTFHKLVCPMKKTSDSLQLDEHNLWLIDDRLAYYTFFASDLELNKFSDASEEDRPDLVIFDRHLSFKGADGADPVVIMEFKRPNDPPNTDPVEELIKNVRLLREHKIRDIKGRVITEIKDTTPFIGYIIADTTPQLEQQIKDRGIFVKTPDGDGYFGIHPAYNTTIEVIPFAKLFRDAKKRNNIFFEKLGLAD